MIRTYDLIYNLSPLLRELYQQDHFDFYSALALLAQVSQRNVTMNIEEIVILSDLFFGLVIWESWTMYLDQIHPSPDSCIVLYTPSFLNLLCLFKPNKSNLCCLHTYSCGLIPSSMADLLGTTPLRNIGFPSSRSYQLPVTPQLGWDFMPTSHSGILSSLSFDVGFPSVCCEYH